MKIVNIVKKKESGVCLLHCVNRKKSFPNSPFRTQSDGLSTQPIPTQVSAERNCTAVAGSCWEVHFKSMKRTTSEQRQSKQLYFALTPADALCLWIVMRKRMQKVEFSVFYRSRPIPTIMRLFSVIFFPILPIVVSFSVVV